MVREANNSNKVAVVDGAHIDISEIVYGGRHFQVLKYNQPDTSLRRLNPSKTTNEGPSSAMPSVSVTVSPEWALIVAALVNEVPEITDLIVVIIATSANIQNIGVTCSHTGQPSAIAYDINVLDLDGF